MNILAFNCSPKQFDNLTSQMIEAFLKGAQSAGAKVEQVNTCDLEIGPCRGCTDDLLFEYKNTCDCNDDMIPLYPKLKQSDVWVFGTSVLENGVPKVFTNVLDRLEPLFHPFVLNGTIKLPEENTSNNGKVLFIGTSNLKDSSIFEEITEHVESVSSMFDREYLGAITRTNSRAIASVNGMKDILNSILNECEEAGKSLVVEGQIDSSSMQRIAQKVKVAI